MDEYSTRRAAGGLVVQRRGPSFLRESTENNRDRNVQVCSRAGCSSRLNQMRDAQISSPSKSKPWRTPFRSAHGKEVVGSSSRAPGSFNSPRKSSDSKKKLAFHLETDSESSSIQDDTEEAQQSTLNSGKTLSGVHLEQDEHEIGDAKSTESGTSSSGLSNRPVKKNSQRFGLGRQDSGAGSSSFGIKQSNQGVRNGASTSKSNLRHLKCGSISDVVASGSPSTPDSSLSRRRDTGRKRIGEPEGSLSARGKKMNGPLMDDRKIDSHSPNRGIAISDTRRTRNLSPAGDNDTASVRTRRTTVRTRLSGQENRNRLPLVESPLTTPSSGEPDVSINVNAMSSENQLSAQSPSNRASSFRRTDSSSERMRSNRSFGSHDVGNARSLTNRDTLRQYNLNGIAEMLLALERIEQEEEPSYEQLLVLETNLFLRGLTFHDQHRDMRLDIDNMSYEELLALEERMGTVSTALPEEDLMKCLKKNIYQGAMDCREDEDDVKCSICQEEYAIGEEVGRLGCDHRYHVDCVNQWLRLKNWCPICKVSVAPSPSASLLP